MRVSTEPIHRKGVDLTITGLTKSYASNEVLKGINIKFLAGEVHALLGPNGAGKSTLLGCLSGAVTPDAGVIGLGSREYHHLTPADSRDAGVAMIYQHLASFDDLTVAQSIFLGEELRLGGVFTDHRSQEAAAQKILDSLEQDINPRLLVKDLPVGQQQIVAIARALRQRPEVLILDEPTAALSTAEVNTLLDLVSRLAHEQGLAIIYVTHLLQEVMKVSDRVTVMRDGEVLWSKARQELEFNDLVQAIAPAGTSTRRPERREFDTPIVTVEDLCSSRIGPIDLTVYGGEIIGVYGLLGSGRTDFLETLAGVRRKVAGQVRVGGVLHEGNSPAEAQQAGVVLVPSDRQEQALYLEMRADENILIPHYNSIRRFWRSRSRERSVFAQVAEKTGLVPNDPSQLARAFSGGNAQKISVGRWLTDLDDTQLLLLDEPTQGVDVGARDDLYNLFESYVTTQNRAIIFSSNDADEITLLADRALVMFDGVVVAEVDPKVGEDRLIELANQSIPTQEHEKKSL